MSFTLGQEVWVISKFARKLPDITCPVCLGAGFLRNHKEERFKCLHCDEAGTKEAWTKPLYSAGKDRVYCVVHFNWAHPTELVKLWHNDKLYAENSSFVSSVLDIFEKFYEIYEGWQNVNCQNVQPLTNIFATEEEALAKCAELNAALTSAK